MPRHRPIGLVLLAAALASGTAASARAQQPVGADSAHQAPVRLPEVVSVARAPDTLALLPMATGVVGTGEIRAGRTTFGLDQALAFVPGVQTANRYNFSLDQRLAMRGF